MNLIKIVFLFLFVCLFGSIRAQDKVPITYDMNTEEFKVSLDAVENIKRSLEIALGEYQLYATLFDKEEKAYTEAFNESFVDLFNSGALVFRDYNEPAQASDRTLINPRKYASNVQDNFSRGIRFSIRSAEIVSVKKVDDLFIVKVNVTKAYSNYLAVEDGKGTEQVDISQSVEKSLIFEYNLFEDDLESPLIYKIKNKDEIKDNKPPVQILSFYTGFGLGSMTHEPTDYWSTNNNKLESSTSKNFNLGVEFTTTGINSRSNENKRFGILGGIRFSSENHVTKTESFSMMNSQATVMHSGGETRYARFVEIESLKEETTFNQISFSLGAAYRVLESRRTLLMLNAKIVPSFFLNSSTTFEGSGTWDAQLYHMNANEWVRSDIRLLSEGTIDPNYASALDNITELGGYEVYSDADINADINDNIKIGTSSLSARFEFSPTAYIYVGSPREFGWGLTLGADIGFGLSSLYNHKNQAESYEGEMLNTNRDLDNSLLNLYTTGVNNLYYGVRIGLHQRKEPRNY